MNITTEATRNDPTLLQPRQSLQNIGEKKKDDGKDGQAGFQAFGADGFTFLDFLDIINPLQHIPVIATIYRNLTGDQIDPGSRIAGGTLFGGPVGAIVATANVALEETTGKDMGDRVMAFLGGRDEPAGGAPAAPQQPVATAETVALSGLSPITANLEVLEWARREAALMAGGPAPMAAQPPPIGPVGPVEDPLSRTVENKKPPDNKADGVKSYDIAANIEVRDWALAEARLAGSPESASARPDRRQADDRERLAVLDSARQKAVAAGLTQAQLSGAAAPSGGWFSETMLLALASYQDSAGLGKAGRVRPEIGAADQNMDQ